MQMMIREQIDKRLRSQAEFSKRFPHLPRLTASERVLNAAMECKNAAGCILHEHGEAAKRLENLAGEIYNIALDLTPE